MAAVLEYNKQTVSPSGGLGVRSEAPSMAGTDIPARQQQELGQAEMSTGHALNAIEQDQLDRQNRVHVTGALNELRATADDLAYNPNDGYVNIKGGDVLKLPSGQPLGVDYTGRLDKRIGEISQGLTNQAQKDLFAEQAGSVRSSFYDEATRHENREWNDYTQSTFAGAVKLSADAIGKSSDPVVIGRELENIGANVHQLGSLKGMAANEIAASTMDAQSGALSLAVLSQLDQGNNTAAMGLFDRFKGRMTADDILKVQTHVTEQTDLGIAQAAAEHAVGATSAAVNPGDFDRMTAITAQSESRGRNLNMDGSPVTSRKGARYAMQVMPGTQASPGFGVAGLPPDATPEQVNAQGSQYLAAMVKRYGDPAKAWAAYNDGPGNVDAALKTSRKDGSDWLAHLPPETRAYVSGNMAALQKGGNASAQKVTPDEVLADLGTNPALVNNPRRMKLAQQQALTLAEQHNKSIDLADEQGYSDALTQLAQNGGNFNALSASTRAAIPPDKLDSVVNFARSWAKGADQTDPAVYEVYSNPDRLRQLGDADFLALRSHLSEADWKHLSSVRQEARGGKSSTDPATINPESLNRVLTTRLETMGVNVKPKAGDTAGLAQLGAVRKYVTDAVLKAQQSSGVKFKDADLSQFVDRLFAQSVHFDNTFMGFSTGQSSQRLLSMTPSDVPSADRSRIKQLYQNAGLGTPSDSEILGRYWREHNQMFAPKPKAKPRG